MKLRYVKSFGIAAFAALGVLPVIAQAQLVDLGATTGYALNNLGEAALASGIYANGAVAPVPAIPNQLGPGTPYAINDKGQSAGSAGLNVGLVDNANPGVATLYSGTTATDLFPAADDQGNPDSDWGGRAVSINSAGTVLGYYGVGDRDPETLVFTYLSGTMTLINVPCGLNATASAFTSKFCGPNSSVINIPYGINDSGEIVGEIQYQTSPSPYYAYLVNDAVWTCLGPGTANAINASGEVTGSIMQSSGTTTSHAFLYKGGTTTNLGTLPGGKNSAGYAINAAGQIVGSSDFKGSSIHGFFYNGVMTDLNSLVSSGDPLQQFVTLTGGVGINDSRLILANGVDSRTGATHAYLLQGPWIDVGPAALTFAAAVVGSTSPTQAVTVSNSGTSAIAVGAITASTGFSIKSNGCSASLAPGGQCTVAIAYTPVISGPTNGTLTVPSAGVNYLVALSGAATITGTMIASAKTATVGQPLTLTWTASAGSFCIAKSSSTNTAWTASKPPFTGTIPASGKRTLTETVDGTVTYTFLCSVSETNGAVIVDVPISVVWSWPSVTATISTSPASITAGEAVTLTWSSSNATSCSASGGGESDGWPGSKATSGSQVLTESFAPTTGTVTLVYTITCTSSTSGLTSHASAQVDESQPPPSSGGGGFDLLSLAGLTGLLALRLERARRQ